jgi:hypothetical protein
MRPSKVVAIVIGALLLIVGFFLLVPGIFLLTTFGALKDEAARLRFALWLLVVRERYSSA